MKKLLQTTAIGLALGLIPATGAMADVFVTATITKTVDLTVTETVAKTKYLEIDVNFDRRTLTGAAEANAVANVTNIGNTVTFAQLAHATNSGLLGGLDGASTAMLLHKTASISNSIDGNNGIVGVNQDVGNMANQSNIVAFATDVFSNASSTGVSAANSQADVTQTNTGNSVWHVEAPFTGTAPPFSETASIDGSINSNVGVVGVNQNAGNMNNQTNSLAMAVGPNSVYALGEADLGQENAHNVVSELNTGRSDSITGSVNNNTGIVQVNQSVGNMNNQASAFSISVLTSAVTISP